MRCIYPIFLAFLAAAWPAAAQQRVVVPVDAEVVVPSRGAAGPRLVNAPRPRIPGPRRGAGERPMIESSGGNVLGAFTVPALIALPLAAAAIAAASVPGGGGGSSTSAPARTR